jgi:hypothetical protein
MGNRNILIDEKGVVIGEYNTSLACFSLVCELVKKYNPGQVLDFYNPDKVNDVLAPVYDRCQHYEKIELLLFINDATEFDQGSIPALDEAIEKYSFANDGPKKHLVFIRSLLDKHLSLKTKYMDTTVAMTVVSE